MTLSVGVNMLWCVPGHVGGSEEYFVRQLLGLSQLADRCAVTAFVPRGFVAVHPEVASAVEVVEAGHDCRSRARRVFAENTWLYSRSTSFDLVHHGGGTMPSRSSSPSVVTVHDLQYLTYPQYFTRTKLAYLGRRVPNAVRRATVVAVPSEHVKSTVVTSFGVDPSRVVVVRHGIESTLGSSPTPEAELRRRFSITTPRVLVYPAITHPHKNHEFLLRLLASAWSDPQLGIVFAGGAGLADDDVSRLVSELGLSSRVVRTGRVSPADRDGLIAMAEAVVFPSKFEGFGAPVLEAMAIGTPVIASDATALPEVIADGGIVRGLEANLWADALDVVRERRSELIVKGRARAANFSAVESARDLLGAYELAVRA